MDSIKPPVSQQESWHGDKLHSLLRICQKINSERDLAAVLDLIAREATKLVEADRSSIFLLDQEKRTLWSQVTQDGETIQLDARLGLAGAVVMTGQSINVIDAYNDPRKPIYVHGQGGSMTPRNKVTLQKKFSMMIDA